MRLFVILNTALDTGLKMAQAIHAFRAFVGDYPHLEEYWHREHNNIVVLQDDDLPSLAGRLEEAGFRLSRFHEPDRDNELTGLCVEPAAWKQVSSLPLAS